MINLDCESLYEFCPPDDAVDVGAYSRAFCAQSAPLRVPTPAPEIDHIRALRQLLEDRMHLNDGDNWRAKEEEYLENPPKRVLPVADGCSVFDRWTVGGFKKIVTIMGPAIYNLSEATSSGGSRKSALGPNFGTVLTERCHQLVDEYRLPSVSALFEMDQFVHKPKAFYQLARDIFPGTIRPTVYHYFVKMLSLQGTLLRHYTLNIDMMERMVGLPDELLVEASGTFHTSHCIDCGLEHSFEFLREQLCADQIPRCVRCRSLVRPDLVFVGEMMPAPFYALPEKDLTECDLLFVMGTQLEAKAVAELFDRVTDECVRFVMVDNALTSEQVAQRIAGWQVGEVNRGRDVLWRADPEEGIWDLARELEMLEQLEYLILDATKTRLSLERSTASVVCDSAETLQLF